VYSCGERLVELTIAHELSVSQNTVREALALLEQDGWVVKRARYGVTVRSFTTEEAEELYTLRAALERLTLDWALDAITRDHKAHLASIIGEARIQAGMGMDRGVREAIFTFHEAILDIANRPQTARLLRVMLNQTRLLGNLRAEHDPDDSDAYAGTLTGYGALMTHIRYGNREAAQAALYEVIMAERKSLLTVLDLVGSK
jgi:DNA-binding GntR family transcriptional regulator